MLDLVASLGLLAGVLAVAVAGSRRWEPVVAVAAAGLLLAIGAVSPSAAGDELRQLAPVLVFLAAVLVLGTCCAVEGVFAALGSRLAHARGGPHRLLLLVFATAASVTSVLSLDATVVLLTPVVLAAAGELLISPRPYVYATGHVANSGSLLLPTGNLTNLLALSAAGVTLVHFAALMLLPQLLVLTIEYGVFRAFFRRELSDAPRLSTKAQIPIPWFAVAVLALTLLGFIVTSLLDVPSYWAGVAGAATLATHALVTGKVAPPTLASAADVPFLAFVCGLAVVVRSAVAGGLGDAMQRVLPGTETLAALLLTAAVAAALANVVNNLPAMLILLPVVSGLGTTAVLAALVGVNVGPNLTYPGSLATLLWRRVLRDHGLVPSLRRFTALGLLTVPACLVVGVFGVWLSARV